MLLTTLLFALLSTSIASKEDTVPEYSDADFDLQIADHETSLVMFYAPWCGHCKKLKPEYAKAAKELQKSDPPVNLAKVDCTEGGKETCKKHSVSGYPTLKIFRHGKFKMEYSGSRDAPGIVKVMKTHAGPSMRLLGGQLEIEAFIRNSTEVVIVGVFEKHSNVKSIYQNVAEKMRGVAKFGFCDDQSVLEDSGLGYGITMYQPMHLRNKFEENSFVFQGFGDDEDEKFLVDFINSNLYGLVGHRTTINKDDFKSPLVIAYYDVDYVKNPKGTNYWRNRILKIATNYKDRINFAISSISDFEEEMAEFGFEDEETKKPIVVAKDEHNEKFVMNEEFSVDNLDEFIRNLLDGKLEPYIKSEPIPKDNKGPVKKVVGRNFEEMVLNNDKDAMIEFYAPWCGHCKKLAPIYEELAQKIGEDVDLLKMDATANDIPSQFETKGYPTIYWVPKNEKEKPVKYEGEKDLKSMLSYIAKHSTEELKNYNRKGKLREKTEL